MPPGGMQNARPGPAGGVPPSMGIQRAAPSANPGTVAPPTQTINKSQFLAPKGQAPTANLLAPVVIAIRTRRAVQAIRPDQRYGCREPLEVEEAVCS